MITNEWYKVLQIMRLKSKTDLMDYMITMNDIEENLNINYFQKNIWSQTSVWKPRRFFCEVIYSFRL